MSEDERPTAMWTAAGSEAWPGLPRTRAGRGHPIGNIYLLAAALDSILSTAAGVTMGDVDEPMIIECIRGKDRKLYPAGQPLPAEWRWRVIALCHQLHCEQGLSVRQVQAELLRRGYRRSRGIIHFDLGRPMATCPRCRGAGDG